MGWLWGSDSSSSDSGPSTSSRYDSSSSYRPEASFSSSSYDPGSFESSSSFGSSFGDGGIGAEAQEGGSQDAELQTFIAMQQQRAQFQASVHKMNDTCWDACAVGADTRLGSRTETCLTNCVDRFIDSSLFITNRFTQLLSKQAGALG